MLDLTGVEQVGGNHYQASYQHWDLVDEFNISYLEANATKYVSRYENKNGIQDLEKSVSYIKKRIASLGQPSYRRFSVPLMKTRKWFDSAKIGVEEQEICLLILYWDDRSHLEEAIERINDLIIILKAEERGYVNQ